MERLRFNISKQNIVCDRKTLVSDTENVYECEFEFDEEWQGYQKWAVFKQGDNAYKVLLDNDFCIMPSQAIVDKGYVCVGVCGMQADKRYPTIYTFPILVQEGCADGILPPAPTPSEWEQVLEYMAKIDVFETYIPDGTSEDNQLINESILNDEKTNQPIQNSTKLFTSDGAFLLKQQVDGKVPIDTRLTNSQIDEIFN